MTGMVPLFGVGAVMPGSTFGGHSTPLLWLSLPLRFWSEELLLPCAHGWIGGAEPPVWQNAGAELPAMMIAMTTPPLATAAGYLAVMTHSSSKILKY